VKARLKRFVHSGDNCYLVVNGLEVEGSFDELVKTLGERVDIK
jgi:hypothetical protein